MSFDLRRRRRAPHFAHGDAYAHLELEQRLFARRGMCFVQHDMDVANGSGATVRADLNNALDALATLSSGGTQPATTQAYQLWADTTAGLLKQRNAANTSWEVRDTLAETLAVARSSNTILAAGDQKKLFFATADFTQTLTAAATLDDGWYCFYRVAAGITTTIDPNGAETIDGAATKVIEGPAGGILFCDGTTFHTFGFESTGIKLGTTIATTSGTAHNFTVSSGTRRVSINFASVSLSVADHLLVQIGPAAGVETTVYASTAMNGVATPSIGIESSTAGFIIIVGDAARIFSGRMVLELLNPSTNQWAETFAGKLDPSTVCVGGGDKTIAGELINVRVTRVGAATFDAGSVNVSAER